MRKRDIEAFIRLRKEKSQKRRKSRAKALKQIPAKALLDLLPKAEMEAIAEDVGVDHQVKHLYGPLLVQLFILGILENKDDSLSSLTRLYNSQEFSVFSGKGGHQTAKSSLSDRFSKINCAYFERLYEAYVSALQSKYGKRLNKEMAWLTRYDSTMLALSASLTQIGMRVGARPKKGQGKVQIKVSLGLKGLLPSSLKIFHEQSKLSEDRALKEVIETEAVDPQGVITFDMGLKKRQTFKEFSQKGRFFVTRLHQPRFKQLATHRYIKGRKNGKLQFLSDDIVYLYSSGNKDSLVKQEFRLIQAKCVQGQNAGKTFFFLTNLLDLTAFEIADIYLRRWDIEIFFRFLKQQVGLTHLLSTKENGIKAVIYLRILVGTMIWVFAHLNKRTDYKGLKDQFFWEIRNQISMLQAKILIDSGDVKPNLSG